MRIGPYEVVSTLGQGGMGVVYAARSPDGGDVAIKVLRKDTREVRVRFERERRLLASFGAADGFVPLLDAGVENECPFIVMPLLEGGTLRDRLGQGALEVGATIALGKTLARALARAHERGIVHRDVKPENVLFDASGAALLADLGLAKHFSQDSSGASQSVSLSVSGTLRGTAGYMPPEQLRDSKAVGPAADVFALGAVLYECLAGVPAFSGSNLLELASAVMEGRVEPIAQRRGDAPAWLGEAIERALARDPRERFADGHALGAALAAGRPGRSRWLWLALAPLLLLLGAAVVAIARRSAPPTALPTAPPTALATALATALPTAPPPFATRPAPVPPRELARRWAFAAAVMTTHHDGFEEECLGGHRSTPEANEVDRARLESSWRVTSREELITELSWLRDQGDSARYEEIAAHVAADPVQARLALESPDVDPALAARLQVVIDDGGVIGTKHLIAWDQTRLIGLAGRGVRVGFLSEAEAWSWIGPAAKRLQKTYGSWEELARHYRYGRRFWNPNVAGRSDELIARFLRDPASPWRRYAWQTDLDAGSPWQEP
jgi:serine/threonine-protein kinase